MGVNLNWIGHKSQDTKLEKLEDEFTEVQFWKNQHIHTAEMFYISTHFATKYTLLC